MAKPEKRNENHRWVIFCTDRQGYKGWYGQGERCRPMVMSYLGNAYRYANESDALAAATRASGLAKFTVQELPARVRFKKSADGSEGST